MHGERKKALNPLIYKGVFVWQILCPNVKGNKIGNVLVNFFPSLVFIHKILFLKQFTLENQEAVISTLSSVQQMLIKLRRVKFVGIEQFTAVLILLCNNPATMAAAELFTQRLVHFIIWFKFVLFGHQSIFLLTRYYSDICFFSIFG